MLKEKKKEDIVGRFLASTPKETEYFVQHTLDIAYQVSELLKSNKLSQNELSKLLGKEKSEISKWLSGNHNLTLKSISKLEAVLKKQIIFTREELICKILPMIYRKLGDHSFNKEQLDNLITFYSYSESLDNFVSPSNRGELKISGSAIVSTYDMDKKYPITEIINLPVNELAA
jgi:transcriptional regulator with XRE-family HTH domain